MPPTASPFVTSDYIADLRRLATAAESGMPVESVKLELNRHLFLFYHTVRDQIEFENQLRTTATVQQLLAYGLGLLAGVGLLIAGVASPAVAFVLQLLMLLACVSLIRNVRVNSLDAVIAHDRIVATDIVTKYLPQVWETKSPNALRAVTEHFILDLERSWARPFHARAWGHPGATFGWPHLEMFDWPQTGRPAATWGQTTMRSGWPHTGRPAVAADEREVGPVVCVWLFAASLLGLTHAVYQQSWPVALACAFAAHLLALTWWAITRPLPVRPDPA